MTKLVAGLVPMSDNQKEMQKGWEKASLMELVLVHLLEMR